MMTAPPTPTPSKSEGKPQAGPGSSWPATLLKGRLYGVCGLGRNGAAVVEALLGMGARVQAWDDNKPTLPDRLAAHPGLTLAPLEDLAGMTALILSPGIPHHLPQPHPVARLAREQHIPILSDAELLWQVARKAGSQARFVSITGTNGKSTTTALLTHILTQAGIPACSGGNLGTAALALPALGDDGVYVIEMSSYMLERLSHYHASAAALLNLTPDHLDRHGNMAGYLEAKAHVFDHMTKGDLAVFGEDAPWTKQLKPRLARQGVETLTLHVNQAVPAAEAPFLPGLHNAQNIGTCRAIARHLGLSEAQIAHGIATFGGLAHRLQQVARSGGICFINDSKATNAEASAHALKAYPRLLWIAGGQAKEGGIASLAPLFGHIRHAFLIGQDAQSLADTLAAHDVPCTISTTLAEATRAAWDFARNDMARGETDQSDIAQGNTDRGKIIRDEQPRTSRDLLPILLSPACASFDQFRSFEERGERFTQLARSLCAEEGAPHPAAGGATTGTGAREDTD